MLLAAAAMCLCVQACADRAVDFDEIRGARMVDKGIWRLALAGPEVGKVITRECDIQLPEGGEAALIPVPDSFSNREFTVLLRVDEAAGGPVRLCSEAAPEDLRTIMVSQEGWRAIRFGQAKWEGELPLRIRSESSLRIGAVTVCRTFRQMFGRAGQIALEGAGYRKLGEDEILSPPLLPGSYRHYRTRQWNAPPVGEADGLSGVDLKDHYQPLLVGPAAAESGLETPVRSRDSVVICLRIKGRFGLVVYPELAKYTLTRAGEQDQWSTAALRFDGALLDGDGNGIYTGCKKLEWLTGRTWMDNFGFGFMDFVAVFPQNEIPFGDGKPTHARFDYQAQTGTESIDLALPAGADALAFVSAKSGRTRVLVRVGEDYRQLAQIDDSHWTNCLGVIAGSLHLRGE